jgi:hypothetical protein
VSTRLDSKGTGLGLAVAEGIVREHGGLLRASNRVDRRGAVFEVVLPAEVGGVGGGLVADNARALGSPVHDGGLHEGNQGAAI